LPVPDRRFFSISGTSTGSPSQKTQENQYDDEQHNLYDPLAAHCVFLKFDGLSLISERILIIFHVQLLQVPDLFEQLDYVFISHSTPPKNVFGRAEFAILDRSL